MYILITLIFHINTIIKHSMGKSVYLVQPFAVAGTFVKCHMQTLSLTWELHCMPISQLIHCMPISQLNPILQMGRQCSTQIRLQLCRLVWGYIVRMWHFTQHLILFIYITPVHFYHLIVVKLLNHFLNIKYDFITFQNT